MASKSPSVPQTAPAMVPKCSSRLMRITESPVFWSVLRGANVRMASHPGCKSTLCIWLKGPKCIKRSPTWDLVPAWIFKSYTRLVVKLFKYIWKKYKILKTDAKILRLLKCNCNNALLLAYLLTLQLLEQFTIFHLKFYRIIEEKKEFGKRCFLLKAFKKKARGFESFFSNPLIVVCHLCNACVFYTQSRLLVYFPPFFLLLWYQSKQKFNMDSCQSVTGTLSKQYSISKTKILKVWKNHPNFPRLDVIALVMSSLLACPLACCFVHIPGDFDTFWLPPP